MGLQNSTLANAATLVLVLASLAHGQTARWAAADDPVAKQLINWERRWAEADCDRNTVVETILADDFQGTAPDTGALYSKTDSVAEAKAATGSSRGCQMLSAKVRYFSADVAVVYGSETSILKTKDGKDKTRILVWTDTWMKRNGKWQIIAVQDMQVAKPPTQ